MSDARPQLPRLLEEQRAEFAGRRGLARAERGFRALMNAVFSINLHRISVELASARKVSPEYGSIRVAV